MLICDGCHRLFNKNKLKRVCLGTNNYKNYCKYCNVNQDIIEEDNTARVLEILRRERRNKIG